ASDLLGGGGGCGVLGGPKMGPEVSFVVQSMYQDKSIYGCRYGTTRPHHDIPLVVQLYLDGKFLLDEMVSQQYPAADVQSALDDLEAGKLNRGVLTFA